MKLTRSRTIQVGKLSVCEGVGFETSGELTPRQIIDVLRSLEVQLDEWEKRRDEKSKKVESPQ